jgi:pimeloyl-ACP methyl ester carboxylesterase/acyl carrier protein
VTSVLHRDAILDAASYAAPRPGVETALGDLWAGVLRLDRVGRIDDFFELGGDSLAAEALFAGIHRALGIELPTAVVLEAPTIAQLAEVIGRQTSTPATLVLLRAARGDGDPLVLVPARHAQPRAYRNLDNALGYRGPIVLLNHAPVERMDELVRRHLEGLVSAGLGPRIHVLGICWGSLVALELARRAPDFGLRTGMVAVFDPPARLTVVQRLRSRLRNRSPLAAATVNRAELYRNELGGLPWRRRPAWAMRKLGALAQRIAGAPQIKDLEAEFAQLSPDEPLARAGLGYLPRPPREPVHLILTRDRPDGNLRRSRPAWVRFLDAAGRTHFIAGESTGHAMLGGGATELAEVIDQLLVNGAG